MLRVASCELRVASCELQLESGRMSSVYPFENLLTALVIASVVANCFEDLSLGAFRVINVVVRDSLSHADKADVSWGLIHGITPPTSFRAVSFVLICFIATPPVRSRGGWIDEFVQTLFLYGLLFVVVILLAQFRGSRTTRLVER